ncbi:hypothetical protein BJ322DRAFT_1167239 [Thelephora terrestris]|uniref:Uncharacterized protein n=1 Tax=Thelephora terrestris TaxID=56493 RepID=A0A9P6L1P2_9AGAM|nr:hypothetical protein BJ322DRAFT_1167239 [Thelephora terrestris]
MFKGFRRLGLAFLDESGAQLEFSAGADSSDERNRTENERDEAPEFDHSDESESDVASQEPGWTAQDGGDYWPYPSKTMLVLDILDNMPHLRLSDDHMKTVLWMLEELNVPDTPSFYALRETQKKLAEEMDIQPREHISALGQKFHAVAPEDLLALDWANPHVRNSMCLYPEVTSSISESWQAGKWRDEVPLDELSPMWADWESSPERHFYVNEVACTKAGKYILPKRWIVVNKKEYAECNPVYFSERRGRYRVRTSEIIRVPVDHLQLTFPEIEALGRGGFQNFSPNPVRTIAKGRPVFSLRVMPWADDVSGNRSKQYNPHINIYMKNLNIPSEKLKQQFFVRFCSTSPNTSSNEQFRAFLENCSHEKYIPAYDCLLKREILFRIFPHHLPADNPQQAESASGIGGNGNLNCIRDKSGGTKEQKESNDVYHALFAPGKIRRMVPETVQIIKQQIYLACEGIACKVSDLQTETGIKDRTAQYWIDRALERSSELMRQRLHEPETKDPRLGGKLKPDERKQIKQMIHSEVSAEVRRWVIEQPPERFNEIPQESCKSYVLPDSRTLTKTHWNRPSQ